jgi:hypothetical protein
MVDFFKQEQIKYIATDGLKSMDTAALGFPDGQRKSCVVCGALMPLRAVKCTICDSFQDWKRYLSVNTTAIALLTALVSVIATSAPTLIGWFEGDNSDLRVNFQRDDHSGGVILGAFNGGNRPGGIKDITLFVPLKNTEGTPLTYRGTIDSKDPKADDSFLAPQSNKPIRVVFDVRFDNTNLTTKDFNGVCVITVETAEFSGPGKKIPLAIPCGALSVVGIR